MRTPGAASIDMAVTNPRSHSGINRLRFAPSIAATLATLTLLPFLCALGFWQLDRAEQKESILNALEKRGLKRGVAAICIGGGEGTAIAIERA